MKNLARPLLICFVLLLITAILSIAVGSIDIPIQTTLQALINPRQPEVNPTFISILWDLRLPRTLLLILVGAGLAGSGCAYQGLFRNPLADPYLIGAASGAGLGAVLAITIHWPASILGYLTIPAAGFMGAVLTVVVVFSIARVGRSSPITTLILAGVAVSSFATALTSLLLINASGELRRALVWLVGGSKIGRAHV